MKPVTVIEGNVAALDRANVDTDQIVPKQFLKRIERTGFGEFLFWDWFRQPGFPLNRIEFHGAPILAAGRNFGSGSSREQQKIPVVNETLSVGKREVDHGGVRPDLERDVPVVGDGRVDEVPTIRDVRR